MRATKFKIIVAYFPIIYTFLQLFVNIIYFINKEFYIENAFYFQNTLGTSLIFSLFLVFYTFFFKFCNISRITSISQLLMSVVYLVIQVDDIYNIIFQILVMVISLLLTTYLYIKKFPTCRLSLSILFSFLLFKNNMNCLRALEDFKDISYKTHVKKYENNGAFRRI